MLLELKFSVALAACCTVLVHVAGDTHFCVALTARCRHVRLDLGMELLLGYNVDASAIPAPPTGMMDSLQARDIDTRKVTIFMDFERLVNVGCL